MHRESVKRDSHAEMRKPHTILAMSEYFGCLKLTHRVTETSELSHFSTNYSFVVKRVHSLYTYSESETVKQVKHKMLSVDLFSIF